MPKETSSIAFEADISEFSKSISQMTSDIRLINSQFDASASEMDDWASSTDGLQLKIDSLNRALEAENQKLIAMTKRREEYRQTLDSNKKKLAELEAEYQKVVAAEGENSKSAKSLAKDKLTVEKAIAKNEQSLVKEELAINKQTVAVNKTKKSADQYKRELDNLGKELDDSKGSTDKLTSSTGKFSSAMKGIGVGLAAGVAAIGTAAVGATKAFLDLADSTREYRTEMAKLKSVSDDAGANFEETQEAYKDLVAVTADEGAATEAINNLLTAGFKGDELDEVNQYLQGAAIKWKDTLKAEGLADSIQEWIGSGGESLTGNIAELLERMGYNLDDVKAKTAGFTEEQRRAYIMNVLQAEGLGEISAAYKEENATLYEAAMAQENLKEATAALGDAADPIVTILRDGLANVLTQLTPLITEVASAFENLLGGNVTEGFEQLSTIFLQIKERAQEMFVGLLNGITEAIPQLMPKIVEFLSTFIQQFVEFTPVLLEAAIQLLMSIVQAIPPTITALLEQLPLILNSILTSLSGMIPMLLEAAINVFSTLVEAIPVVIAKLVEILPQILQAITGFIQENLPVILEAAVTLFMKIVEAIPVLLQALADALPTIIGAIVDFVVSNLPTLLKYAIDLFNQIVAAIPIMIVKLGQQLPTIISKIVSTLLANLPKIAMMAFDLFMEIVKAIPKMIIELAKNLPDIITAILDAFKDAPTLLYDAGKDIVEGLWDGISSVGDWLYEKVSGFFGNVEDWAKDILGVHSPSKVFAEIGKYTAEGLGVGFEDEMKNVKKTISNSLDVGDMTGNLTTGSAGAVSPISNTVNLTQVINSPKAVSPSEAYKYAKKMESRYKTLAVGGVR